MILKIRNSDIKPHVVPGFTGTVVGPKQEVLISATCVYMRRLEAHRFLSYEEADKQEPEQVESAPTKQASRKRKAPSEKETDVESSENGVKTDG